LMDLARPAVPEAYQSDLAEFEALASSARAPAAAN
jgi:hypothetical protein